jgi:hypothetical protein
MPYLETGLSARGSQRVRRCRRSRFVAVACPQPLELRQRFFPGQPQNPALTTSALPNLRAFAGVEP